LAGTIAGGRAARDTNKLKYGEDYYSKIGTAGAKAYIERQKAGIAVPRGFAANKELARSAGRVGGLKSRRGSKDT